MTNWSVTPDGAHRKPTFSCCPCHKATASQSIFSALKLFWRLVEHCDTWEIAITFAPGLELSPSNWRQNLQCIFQVSVGTVGGVWTIKSTCQHRCWVMAVTLLSHRFCARPGAILDQIEVVKQKHRYHIIGRIHESRHAIEGNKSMQSFLCASWNCWRERKLLVFKDAHWISLGSIGVFPSQPWRSFSARKVHK